MEHTETITERAIRMRIGERIPRHSPTAYTEFSIGKLLPADEFSELELVRRETPSSPPNDDDLARDAIFLVLRKHHPYQE